MITTTTTTGGFVIYPEGSTAPQPPKPQGTCPNCGYCPHCGRQNAAPYPYVNPYPYCGDGTYRVTSTDGFGNVSVY